MSCNNKTNTFQKTFIIEPMDIGSPVSSACTALYTNLIHSCSGDTSIELTNGNIFFNGNGQFDNISATTIEATTFTSGGTNILDIVNASDTFITGGTYNIVNNSIFLQRNDGANVLISGVTDFYTTGVTLTNDVAHFHRNDQLSAYTLDLSSLGGGTGDDNYVSGGTYNTGTTSLDFVGTNSATTFSIDVSDLKFLNIVDIDTLTGKISLIGYGDDSACKIQRVETVGVLSISTWANGDDSTLDKIWINRYTYSYF